VSMLQIHVNEVVERGLQQEAARRGQSVEDVAAAALEERFAPLPAAASIPEEVRSLFEGLPRRSPADLLALAESQGVKPVEDFEDLLGDFWPVEETCDEFIAWLREGRRDRRSEAPR
jgi:hypothetical protein